MQVADWFNLAPNSDASRVNGLEHKLETASPKTADEDITVYGRRHDRDAEWRAEMQAGQPVYQASNSDAAQPSHGGYPEWTSAEQQRLMSIKTDWLGLCGALGGYIQCPNKPP